MKTSRFSFRSSQNFSVVLGIALLSIGISAQAQNYPVTPLQRATAVQVGTVGIPLTELVTDAPDKYTIKPGDTLWAISRLYLKSPWRWPELWGLNLQDIQNPHLIYPGQMLTLDKSTGRARLSTRRVDQRGTDAGSIVKLSPRTRYESVASMALPTLSPGSIEPFLSEPIVVDDNALQQAPRIVAGDDSRVLLARGDRAYARGAPDSPLTEIAGPARQFRVFRDATPLQDPATGEVLGYEAHYLGRVRLVRGESTETDVKDGKAVVNLVPATIDIVAAREEMRAGDRLLPEPSRQLISYVPRAPAVTVTGGRIVSIYGNAVQFAAQNQIVSINKGLRDGIAAGNVMAILKNGETIIDRTGASTEAIKLPNERAGLLMVFRAFDKVSYALVLEINNAVRAGDRLVNP